EQKVRSLSAGGINTVDPGLWSVTAVLVNDEDMHEVNEEIRQVLEELKSKPVDEVTLEETKSNIRYSYAMSIDSPDEIANSLAWYIWLTNDPSNVNKAYENYDK